MVSVLCKNHNCIWWYNHGCKKEMITLYYGCENYESKANQVQISGDKR